MPGSEPSSGSTAPGTSQATLSAPTATGCCAAHQRDPPASIPPAASVPSSVKPSGVCTRALTSTPPYMQRFSAWWQNASMWVPECSAIPDRV